MANLIKDEVDLLFVEVATLFYLFYSIIVVSVGSLGVFCAVLAGKGNILEVIEIHYTSSNDFRLHLGKVNCLGVG